MSINAQTIPCNLSNDERIALGVLAAKTGYGSISALVRDAIMSKHGELWMKATEYVAQFPSEVAQRRGRKAKRN